MLLVIFRNFLLFFGYLIHVKVAPYSSFVGYSRNENFLFLNLKFLSCSYLILLKELVSINSHFFYFFFILFIMSIIDFKDFFIFILPMIFDNHNNHIPVTQFEY